MATAYAGRWLWPASDGSKDWRQEEFIMLNQLNNLSRLAVAVALSAAAQPIAAADELTEDISQLDKGLKAALDDPLARMTKDELAKYLGDDHPVLQDAGDYIPRGMGIAASAPLPGDVTPRDLTEPSNDADERARFIVRRGTDEEPTAAEIEAQIEYQDAFIKDANRALEERRNEIEALLKGGKTADLEQLTSEINEAGSIQTRSLETPETRRARMQEEYRAFLSILATGDAGDQQ
jgi:hypothetical protein